MATSKKKMKSDYPLPVYNYQVVIGSESVAFAEVSGLEISYQKLSYAESPTAPNKPGPKFYSMPGPRNGATVTLSKGYIRKKSMPALYAWINGIQGHLVDKKDIDIHLLDPDGATVVTWHLKDVYPTRLQAPDFKAQANDVAIETLELAAGAFTMSEAG